MIYRFAPGLGKDRLPVLIARDGALSADSLRTAIALFNQLAAGPESATLADLTDATGLHDQRARAALIALQEAGYIEACATIIADATAASAADHPRPTAAASPPNEGLRRPGKGGRLDAGIMDYEMDIDSLISSGDANIRGTGRRLSGPYADSDENLGVESWGPILGEEKQPPAVRFMVWLRFVLGPEELATCDRFALANKDQWGDWIERFSPAKAAGTEDKLLDDIHRCLRALSNNDAPAPTDPGPDLPRLN